MKVIIDYEFGQTVYLKNDCEQNEHLVNRIILLPKGTIILELLTHLGEYIEVWEGLVSKEKDLLKIAGIDNEKEA